MTKTCYSGYGYFNLLDQQEEVIFKIIVIFHTRALAINPSK